jgi:diadenosine tetraphosphate (Ap4A) HIT family hydrolase
MLDAAAMTNDTASAGWFLHPQLERDTVPIGDLPLCRALLINDANYPWMLLVPRRPRISEIIDLPGHDQVQLMGEIGQASTAMKSATGCDKINVAALGNVVPQFHVHVIARMHGDAAWPKPVWGVVPARAYEAATLQAWLTELRQRLALSAT